MLKFCLSYKVMFRPEEVFPLEIFDIIAGMSDFITRSRLASTCWQLHKRNYIGSDKIIDRPGTYHLTRNVHCRRLRFTVPDVTLIGHDYTVCFLPGAPIENHVIVLIGYDLNRESSCSFMGVIPFTLAHINFRLVTNDRGNLIGFQDLGFPVGGKGAYVTCNTTYTITEEEYHVMQLIS